MKITRGYWAGWEIHLADAHSRRPLPEHALQLSEQGYNSELFVEGNPGQEYVIKLRAPKRRDTSLGVKFAVAVDGRNTASGYFEQGEQAYSPLCPSYSTHQLYDGYTGDTTYRPPYGYGYLGNHGIAPGHYSDHFLGGHYLAPHNYDNNHLGGHYLGPSPYVSRQSTQRRAERSTWRDLVNGEGVLKKFAFAKLNLTEDGPLLEPGEISALGTVRVTLQAGYVEKLQRAETFQPRQNIRYDTINERNKKAVQVGLCLGGEIVKHGVDFVRRNKWHESFEVRGFTLVFKYRTQETLKALDIIQSRPIAGPRRLRLRQAPATPVTFEPVPNYRSPSRMLIDSPRRYRSRAASELTVNDRERSSSGILEFDYDERSRTPLFERRSVSPTPSPYSPGVRKRKRQGSYTPKPDLENEPPQRDLKRMRAELWNLKREASATPLAAARRVPYNREIIDLTRPGAGDYVDLTQSPY